METKIFTMSCEQHLFDYNFPVFLSNINLRIYLIKAQVIPSELSVVKVLILES